MVKRLTYLLIAIIFFITTGCKKDIPVIPPVISQDTTSHNINWIIDEIGNGNYSSTFWDAAIINDTLAYAVGEIHTGETDYFDSTGKWVEPYNMAKWNGQKWEFIKIKFYTICGQSSRTTYHIRSIFLFSETNIWIAMDGNQIVQWDGAKQTTTMCLPVSFSVKKIWGRDSNSVYVVGDRGIILHYTNGIWQKLESGTTVTLRDIWGSPDGSVIWAAGFDDSYGTVFLRNTGNGFEKVLEITDPGMPHPPDKITHVFKSLWTYKEDTVYLGAIGRVYAAPKHTSGSFAAAKENIWWDYKNETGFPPETNVIRGNAGNDIFVGGYLQFVRHWNGASWKSYPEVKDDGTWRGMSVKKDFIIMVGEKFTFPERAIIARGYRIN